MMEHVLERLENVTSRLESVCNQQRMPTGGGGGGAGGAELECNGSAVAAEAPPVVKLYDEILSGSFSEFLALSKKIGGDLNEMAKLVDDAFKEQREFILKAVGNRKPDEMKLQQLMKPMADKIVAIQNYRESKRTSDLFNHLSAISESIPALAWVQVSPTPAPHIKEMSDAAQFYTNRVLKDWKDKDKTHVDWTKAWLQALSELQKYVKQHHTTGLVWNSAPGCAPLEGGGASGKAPPPAAPGAPPPPPPPPMANFNAAASGGGSEGAAANQRDALFAEINRMGEGISKGLKKVTDDQKTHKNPSLRAGSTVPDKERPALPDKPEHLRKPVAASGAAPTAPPKCELEGGKKWIVEFHKGNRNLLINVTDMRQVLYIYKCVDSVVQVKGKINSIVMDNCKKTSVVFDDLVSSVELINCQSVQVQTMGKMPTLTINNCDGAQVYLSKDALDAKIISSRSACMNVLVPDPQEGFKEFPIPEQFETVWNQKKLETTAIENA